MDNQIIEGITVIDIKSNKFFWQLRPWKDGKLATIDGWARFSELSFEGANKIKIKHVVNFPRWQIDRTFVVWPEADLWFTTSARMNHIAYTPNKFTKSFVPFFGTYNQYYPILLDAQEGILAFLYGDMTHRSTGLHYVFYNYKEDTVIYETPLGADDQNNFEGYMGDLGMLAVTMKREDNGIRIVNDYFIYDWKTGSKTYNKLTKKMAELLLEVDTDRALNMERRFLIADSVLMGDKPVKVSWDEKYENIEITPISPLLPESKWGTNFTLSPNGEWALCLLGRYTGLYGENLYKRAFFHIDDRYPGGISFPIIVDYTGVVFERGVFVEHPVHGMCYAIEYHKEERGKDRLYLRLYKMDSVLDEINRQLPNEAP